MEADFVDGSQDLTHEEGITFDTPPEPKGPLRVNEQMVRRLVKIAFLKMAKIREKDFWEMTEEELDEFAPGLTAYINQTDWLADLVEKVDHGAGPGLFLYALLYRAALDFREEQKKRPKPVKGKAEMVSNQSGGVAPTEGYMGEFNPGRGKQSDF